MNKIYKNNINELIDSVSKKNVIFVDCFDTIVYRVSNPDTVLERWFHIIAEKYDVKYKDVKEIWKYSTHCNLDATEENSFETVAYFMYNRFQYLIDDLQEFKDFYSFILETYIDIELSVLRVNTQLYELLKSEKRMSKKIYLVSDFYMPSEFFKIVFLNLKIDDVFDNMYISSDVGYRKSTGSIYNWLLNELQLNANSVLMIGDNKISDYMRPRKHKIDSYRININYSKHDNINYKLWNIFDKQYNKSPLSNYSFSLYLFMDKLVDYVSKNDVKDIYFCSREGEYFKKIFEMLLACRGLSDTVKIHYLLVSRKATFLPSLKADIKEESFDTLRKTTNCISIKEFIGTLGLKVEHFSLYKDIDIERSIFNFFTSPEFARLKDDAMFAENYRRAVLSEKMEFSKYLKSVGITGEMKKITLVDIGWKGTIQDNIYNFFNGSIKIDGLYYGIESAGNLISNNKKYGLVYTDLPTKSDYFDVFSTNHRMLERILQASHGTANLYRDGECVLAELEEKETKLYNLMEHNRTCIYETIKLLDDIFKQNTIGRFQLNEIISFLHETYLLCYSRKLCIEEHRTSELMLMTFGTGKQKISYKSMIKSIIKMPKIEKANKLLKILRKVHFNIISDIIVRVVYSQRRKLFLKMEI